MDKSIRTHLDNIRSEDGQLQNKAYSTLMEKTEKPVDWAYEAWDELAQRRLEELASELGARWDLRKVAILHRTGDLSIGDASVVIAVSAAHRPEAFEACRHAIERLKEDVPIWKKEELTSGDAHWVMGS